MAALAAAAAFRRRTDALVPRLQAMPLVGAPPLALPSLVRAYAERAVPSGPAPPAVRLRQRATVLAVRVFLQVRTDAVFIRSRSSEHFPAANPAAIGPAEAVNQKRFLLLT